MKLKQKFIKFLRSDFDLEKYQFMYSMNLTQWYNSLLLRKMFMSGFTKNIQDRNKKERKLYSSVVVGLLLHPEGKNLETPILDARNYKPVKDLQIEDLFDAKENIEHCMPDLIPLFEKRAVDLKNEVYVSRYDKIETSYHSEILKRKLYYGSADLVDIQVDLAASDEEILESFKFWMTAKRTEIKEHVGRDGLTKKPSDNDLKDWAKKGVLPFLDLLIFSEYFQTKLTNAVIGNFLFPDEIDIDVTERIRKVVKPLANHLTSNGFLNALQITTGAIEDKKRNDLKDETIPE